jgi:hypothetical protein
MAVSEMRYMYGQPAVSENRQAASLCGSDAASNWEADAGLISTVAQRGGERRV